MLLDGVRAPLCEHESTAAADVGCGWRGTGGRSHLTQCGCTATRRVNTRTPRTLGESQDCGNSTHERQFVAWPTASNVKGQGRTRSVQFERTVSERYHFCGWLNGLRAGGRSGGGSQSSRGYRCIVCYAKRQRRVVVVLHARQIRAPIGISLARSLLSRSPPQRCAQRCDALRCSTRAEREQMSERK